jgi:hypothetical protein
MFWEREREMYMYRGFTFSFGGGTRRSGHGEDGGALGEVVVVLPVGTALP